MKTIYFVRHGETASNRNKTIGRAADPLSELGERQASLVADRLKEIAADLIVSSPYRRTTQTAESIAATRGLDLLFSDLFIESKVPSAIEGLPYTHPERLRVSNLLREHWGDPEWHFSDEEDFFSLSVRARQALDFLSKRPESSIIVASHGAFIRMIAEIILAGDLLNPALSTQMYPRFGLSNTGVTVVQVDDAGVWQLIRWNDTVHLDPDSLSE